MGKVKTRLAKSVGDKAALDIYNHLLLHTVKITRELDVAKTVYFTSFISEGDIWDEHIYQKKLQQGGDLGEKMSNAFSEGFENGFEKIIIIGSDLYDLTTTDIEEAFRSLESNDYVIGPAEDGGYYLLGMTKPTPAIFKNKTWSTSTVLPETLTDLQGEKIHFLDTRNDIDTFEDIKGLQDFEHFYEK